MHTGAVITEDGLGHEGYGLAILASYVLDNVLVKQQVICHAGKRGEGHAHFALTRGGNFVVVQVHRHAGGLHGEHELVAQFLQGISWGGREVTTLGLDLSALAAFTIAAPPAFFRFNGESCFVRSGGVANTIEDKELRLRRELDGVGETRAFGIRLSLLRHVARIAGIGYFSDWVKDVTRQDEGGGFSSRVDKCSIGICLQEHV